MKSLIVFSSPRYYNIVRLSLYSAISILSLSDRFILLDSPINFVYTNLVRNILNFLVSTQDPLNTQVEIGQAIGDRRLKYVIPAYTHTPNHARYQPGIRVH